MSLAKINTFYYWKIQLLTHTIELPAVPDVS